MSRPTGLCFPSTRPKNLEYFLYLLTSNVIYQLVNFILFFNVRIGFRKKFCYFTKFQIIILSLHFSSSVDNKIKHMTIFFFNIDNDNIIRTCLSIEHCKMTRYEPNFFCYFELKMKVLCLC